MNRYGRIFFKVILISLSFGINFAQTPLKIAVIGDYGDAGSSEQAVANIVHSWNPDLIVTVGDNNYPDGSASTIDENIGQYYYNFIYPYNGSYGEGASENCFYPSPGNHDWRASNLQPYKDYFELPNNERYYDFVKGPVHFFMVDSDPDEPDGTDDNSVQAQWILEKMENSTSPWKIVCFHHPAYSSGNHGSTGYMQWDFNSSGASIVFAGHDHTYERLNIFGLTYIVNGLGGRNLGNFGDILPESQFRYNTNFGAVFVEAYTDSLTTKFININNEVFDEFKITTDPLPVELTEFSGNYINEKIYLDWKTETEVDNFGFEIEQSVDNNIFNKIGFVEGNGNSNSPKKYNYIDENIESGNYFYRLKQLDTDGDFEYSKVVEVYAGEIPNGFVLNQNYPNPFNPKTNIKFGFTENTKASLIVYDVIGNQVAELFKGIAEAGQIYDVEFNGDNLSSGIYFYKLSSNNFNEVKKMLLVK